MFWWKRISNLPKRWDHCKSNFKDSAHSCSPRRNRISFCVNKIKNSILRVISSMTSDISDINKKTCSKRSFHFVNKDWKKLTWMTSVYVRKRCLFIKKKWRKSMKRRKNFCWWDVLVNGKVMLSVKLCIGN